MYKATQATRLSDWLAQRSASERHTLARIWALNDADTESDAETLARALLQPAVIERIVARLDSTTRRALERVLAEDDAQIAVAVLEREFGSVRSHEQYPNPRAYLLALEQPPSATEKLFTLGLILPVQRRSGRFYRVPDELRPFMPEVAPRDRSMRLATAHAPAQHVDADPFALERNIITIFALAHRGELQIVPARGLNKASLVRLAKRWGQSRDDLRGLTYERHWRYVHFLRSVLQSAGLLRVNADQELRTTSKALEWLDLPRVERLRRLVDGWVETSWDELDHFLGITIKGYAFGQDLAATRRDILTMLRHAPIDGWVAWDALGHEVQQTNPDFLRRDGRYDAWRLVNYRNEPLDGYEHWQDVEGELLRSVIGTALCWLGIVDWGGEPADGDTVTPTSFRLTPRGAAALGIAPAPDEPPDERLVVQGTFEVLVPPHAAPRARFWTAVSANWQSGDEIEHFKLTKTSVQDMIAAGTDVDYLRQVFEEESGGELPPNVAYSLREWSGQLGQLTLSSGALLRANDPLLLEQIRRDKRVQMPPHETLTPDTLLLEEGDAVALSERLRKAGYGLLAEADAAGGPLSERDMTILFGALEFYAAACEELGIDGDASVALRRRVARQLNQRQRQQAITIQFEALQKLRERTRD